LLCLDLYFVFAMFVIQFMKMEGEHSNPLRNIFVFVNEVFIY